jgi:PST family polysaccharide transporter
VVQVLNIIISIVRTKLIAVFIGPAGMGIISLLNSAINIISGVSGLGIETSAVKHISGKHKENDLSSVSTMVSTVKKLVLVTGILARYWRYFFLVVEHNYFWKYRLYFGFYLYLSYGFAKTISFRSISGLAKLEKMRLLKANFYGNLMGLLVSIQYIIITE